MTDFNVGVKVDTVSNTSGIDQVETALKGVATQSNVVADVAVSGAAKQVTSHRAIKAGVESISTQLDKLRTDMINTFGLNVLFQQTKDVAALADAYSNLEARVKLAVGQGPAFETAFQGIFEVAKKTSSAVEETGNLFTKLAAAGKDLGFGNEQALKLTETINQSIQLSGASADASKAAITQLIQGLQSGVLRGDEFNSVMEQSPRLATALADGLGVTIGALRKMAEEGKLTSATIINALKSQSAVIDGEFGKLPVTVGRSMQNLSTEFTKFIGETNKAWGGTEKLAGAITILANNLDTVATVAVKAGEVWAALKLQEFAAKWRSLSATMLESTASTARNSVVTAENSAIRNLNAAASTAQAQAISASATAQTLSTQATAGSAAQMAASSASAGIASKAFGMLGNAMVALRGAALPLLAIDFALNFRKYGEAIGETAAKLMGYKDRTDELARSDRLVEAISRDRVETLKKQAAAMQAATDASFGLTASGVKLKDNFTELTKSGKSSDEAIKAIGKDFNLANMPGIKNAVPVLDQLAATGKITAEQFKNAWSDALAGQDLVAFEVQARAALQGTAREAEQLAQVMQASLNEAVKRTGLDMSLISSGMSKASIEALNNTDVIINGLDKLKSQGIDTQKVLLTSLGKAINTADSQKAIDALNAKIEKLRSVLGDKVADGLLDQAKKKLEEIKEAADQATPGISSVAEAMKNLGIVSDSSLKESADKARSSFEVIRDSGTASVREVNDAWQKYASAAIAANGGVANETIRVEAAMRGLALQSNQTGDTITKAMNNATGATERLIDAQQRHNTLTNNPAPAPKPPDKPNYMGSSGNDMRGVDNSGLNSLAKKDAAGTLSSQDLATAQAAFAAAKNNLTMMQQNQGAFSFEGQRSVQEKYNQAQALLEKIQAQEAAKNNASKNSTSHTVTLNINGKQVTTNVASEADANSLIAQLKKAGMAS